MTFQQLQYIIEIQNTGSFSQAARNFYVSQASISQAVTALEKELGVQIFQRSWNGVQPTQQGVEVLKHANRIYESYRLMSRNTEGRQREVRLSFVAYTPLNEAFTQLYAECRAAGIRLSQITVETEDAAQALSLHEVELCLLPVLQSSARECCRLLEEKGMSVQTIGAIPAVIQIAPAHHLYRKSDLTARDFENEVIIDRGVLAKSFAIKPYLNVDYGNAILVDNPYLRRYLLDRGRGYVISYPSVVSSWMREIPAGFEYKLIAATNPQRPVQPEVLRFLELVEEELAKMNGEDKG